MKTKLLSKLRKRYCFQIRIVEEGLFLGQILYCAIDRFNEKIHESFCFNQLMEDIILTNWGTSTFEAIRSKHSNHVKKRFMKKRVRQMGFNENQILWLKKE